MLKKLKLNMLSFIVLWTVLGLLPMTIIANEPLFSLGLVEFTYIDTSRIFENKPRFLEVTIWYPTHDSTPSQIIKNDTWKIKNVIKNASLPSNQTFPLIIFSHGFSGNQWQNSWFAEFFAQQGYIVASVRHYGNSMPLMIPEICVRPWNRPEDMSFILDNILQESFFKEHIDSNKIVAAGFSQGGIACMWLAGIQAHLTPENIQQQITMMNDATMRSKFFKNVPSEKMDSLLDEFTTQDFKEANRLYYDSRFKAVFAIAPGIDDQNVMFTAEGLSKAQTPTYIIVGESDEGTVEQIPFFTEHIPFCKSVILPGYVTHWTLLNEGTQEGKDKQAYITVDHPSINRNKIHQFVALEALHFFDTYLK